jgi:chromosome segregation ATPase
MSLAHPELQSNFEVVMSQNSALSGELDALRESLTRLQSSANQTLADLSEKEAELRIQKRERFECESKLYAAATEQDRMKAEAHAAAGKFHQVDVVLHAALFFLFRVTLHAAGSGPRLHNQRSTRQRRR